MRLKHEAVFHATRYIAILALALILLGFASVLILDRFALARQRAAAFERMDQVARLIRTTDRTASEISPVSTLELFRKTRVFHGMDFVSVGSAPGTSASDGWDGPEFSQAMKSGRGFRFDEENGVQHLVWAVDGSKGLEGFLTMSLPMESRSLRRAFLFRSMGMGALLVFVVGALFMGALARRHASRIEALRRYAEALARGSHQEFSPTMPTWELEQCMESLKSIAAELTTRIQRGAQNKKELETILTSMTEGLLAVDASKKVILMNETCRRLLGVEHGTRAPAHLQDVEHHEVLEPLMNQAMEHAEPVSRELVWEGETGDRIVSVRVAPLRDQDRNIGGSVCLLSDVTTMRRLENMRREFVANVSHELKTPLTAIQGAAETVSGDRDMPVEVRQRFLSRIVVNAQRLDNLINDVLELSRLQSHEGYLTKGRLNLRGLVEESVLFLRESAEKKGLNLSFSCIADEAWVWADHRALKSVVENLLANAIKYTSAGGHVQVRLATAGGQVVLEVEDSGVGIAREHQDRIFERFYRVDGARSRDVGGTGLGLAIVKNCVMAHNGRITVRSEEGHGSVFRVALPLWHGRDERP